MPVPQPRSRILRGLDEDEVWVRLDFWTRSSAYGREADSMRAYFRAASLSSQAYSWPFWRVDMLVI